MPLSPVLTKLTDQNLEGARMIALGKITADLAKKFNLKKHTIRMWRRSPLFRDKVREYRIQRDKLISNTLDMATSARDLLVNAEIPATKVLIAQLERVDKPNAQYAAAIEILKLLGRYATEKGGQIIINISAADRADMAEGRRLVTIPVPTQVDDTHCLPVPYEAPCLSPTEAGASA